MLRGPGHLGWAPHPVPAGRASVACPKRLGPLPSLSAAHGPLLRPPLRAPLFGLLAPGPASPGALPACVLREIARAWVGLLLGPGPLVSSRVRDGSRQTLPSLRRPAWSWLSAAGRGGAEAEGALQGSQAHVPLPPVPAAQQGPLDWLGLAGAGAASCACTQLWAGGGPVLCSPVRLNKKILSGHCLCLWRLGVCVGGGPALKSLSVTPTMSSPSPSGRDVLLDAHQCPLTLSAAGSWGGGLAHCPCAVSPVQVTRTLKCGQQWLELPRPPGPGHAGGALPRLVSPLAMRAALSGGQFQARWPPGHLFPGGDLASVSHKALVALSPRHRQQPPPRP